MEKQIIISLDEAQKMWKDATETTKKVLLEKLSQQELEGKKGFTWEDSFDGIGFFITGGAMLSSTRNLEATAIHKNIFKTKKQALSSIAFAQLSHIVAKYNEGKVEGRIKYSIDNNEGKLKISAYQEYITHLQFFDSEDAKASFDVNRELWNQYHMID